MPPRSSSYHHGDLRAALLSEAEAMIAEGGTASVTMRELGRRVGVSRAAAYRHFADKDALLVEVAAVGFERLGARLRSVEVTADPDGFRRLGQTYVRFALDNPAHYRLMYGKEALTRADHPDLREWANTLFDELVDLFRAQQRAGTIRRQDPRTQAYVAWSAMHGLASLLIEGQIMAPVDAKELVRDATDVLLDGMRTS